MRNFQIFLILFFAPAIAVAQIQSNWEGGGSDNGWSTSQNWNPEMTPNNDDMNSFDVFMDAAVTSLSENVTISSLVMGQGSAGGTTINNSGLSLTVEGPLAVDFGRLTGGGTFMANSGVSVARTLEIGGNWIFTTNDIQLDVGSGNSSIELLDSARLNVDGSLTFLRDGGVEGTTDPASSFSMRGDLIKSGGFGLALIDVPFTMESGTIQVSSGTLDIDNSADVTATLIATNEGTIAFSGTVALDGVLQTSGNGSVAFDNAIVTSLNLTGNGTDASFVKANSGTEISSATLNLANPSYPFRFDGTSMAGVTNQGYLVWNRGKVIGSGITNAAGAHLETVQGISGVPEIENGTLTNQGEFLVSRTIDILDQGKLDHIEGTLRFTGNGRGINARAGGEQTGLITHVGNIVMNSGSSFSRSTISAPLSSMGMIDIDNGELRFANSNDDKIQFNGTNVSIDAGNGDGAQFTIGANSTSRSKTNGINFTISNGGLATFLAGQHELEGQLFAIGEGVVSVESATVLVESGKSASINCSPTSPFSMFGTNATLNIDGSAQNAVNIDWLFGALTGTASDEDDAIGSLTNASSGELIVSGIMRISRGMGGKLVNNGLVKLTGSLFQGITLDADGVLQNNTSGAVEFAGDQDITEQPGGNGIGTIKNDGTIEKTMGDGVSLITANYEQSQNGTLRSSSGLVRLFGNVINLMGGKLEASSENGRILIQNDSTTEDVILSFTDDGKVEYGSTDGNTIHQVSGKLGTEDENQVGTVLFSGGTMQARDAVATFEIKGNAAFRQVGGTLGATGKALENKGNAEMAGGLIVGDFFNRAMGAFLLEGGVVGANLFANDGAFQWDGGTLDTQLTTSSDATMDISADGLVLLASGALISNSGTTTHTGIGDVELGENAQIINESNGDFIFNNGGDIQRIGSAIQNAMFTNTGRIANEGGASSSINVNFTSIGGTIEATDNGDMQIFGVVGEQGGEPLINGGSLRSATGMFSNVVGTVRTLGALLRGTITHDLGGGGSIEHMVPNINFSLIGLGDGTTAFNGGNTPDGGGMLNLQLGNDVTIELTGNMQIAANATSTGGFLHFDNTKYDLFRNADLGSFDSNSDIEFESTTSGNNTILRGPVSGDRQPFTIQADRTAILTGNSTLRLEDRIELINNGTLEFVATNGGIDQSDFLGDNPLFRNEGTVIKRAGVSTGATGVGVNFINGGTVQVSDGSLSFAECLNLNGTELEGGSWIVDNAGLSLNEGISSPILTNNATVTLRGTEWSFGNIPHNSSSDFFNDDDGALNIEQGAELIINGEFENDGTVNVDAQSRLTVGILDNDGSLNVNGELNVVAQATFQSGVISGTGTINGTDIVSSARTSPGNSPGELTINGNFENTPLGVIDIELGGNGAVTEYDVLTVNGGLTLDGMLEIQLLDNFEPLPSDTFTIITMTDTAGAFDNAPPTGGIGTLATADGEFVVTYSSNEIVLSGFIPNDPFLMGDLNCDGAVNGQDIAALTAALQGETIFAQQFPECAFGRSDLNGDGQTDAADLLVLVDLLVDS